MVKTKLTSIPVKSGSKIGVLLKLSNFKTNKKLVVALIIIVVTATLLYFKTGWFIAAIVNGSPITNFELFSRMNRQYRKQALTQLIDEKIITLEMQKNRIVVSKSDIDQRISQIEANVGGTAALDNLLAQQGQTRADVAQQLKFQLGLEKMYSSQATVSAEEITQYLEQNKSQLTATDAAGQIKEAENILRQQKFSQVFNSEFEKLKQSAQTQIF